MASLHKSKLLTGLALLMVTVCICLTFPYRSEWWNFIDVFCFFMACFLQLMALMLGKTLVSAGKKLSMCALVFCILGVIALIAEAVAWFFIF